MVASNASTPKEAVRNLLIDKDDSVREAAQRHAHAEDMAAFF
jgi:hypothetical protein